MRGLSSICFSLLTLIDTVSSVTPSGTRHSYLDDDKDLWHYVSRPDLKPPKFEIDIKRDTKKIAPGYWFVAPYGDLKPGSPSRAYTPYQIGPHIYDGNGELVWSGAHLFKNRQTFDLRVTEFNGSPALSFILWSNIITSNHPYGAGVVLDSSYQIQKLVENTLDGRPKAANMHEFLLQKGDSALLVTGNTTLVHVPSLTGPEVLTWVSNNGFREIDLKTDEVLFEWWALDHLDPRESYTRPSRIAPTVSDPLDLFHLNSVNKTPNGDYIISCRFTNAIYRISAIDGSIIWKLGGKNSSFELLDFDFSNQHDARWHSDDGEATFLTFMNNGANSHVETRNFSSANYVRLDLKEWKATCITEMPRPDGRYSRLRGNTQVLPNGNYFVGWSDESVISEFASDGTLLLNASFTSPRFVTYRSYKFQFSGRPTEDPALRVFKYGVSQDQDHCVTTCYVSLNGATDIAQWKFYTTKNVSGGDVSTYLGSVNKTSFESMFVVPGCHDFVRAEAFDTAGNKLHESKVITAEANILKQGNVNPVFDAAYLARPQGLSHLTLFRGTNSWQLSRWIHDCIILSIVAAIAFSCGRCMGRPKDTRTKFLKASGFHEI